MAHLPRNRIQVTTTKIDFKTKTLFVSSGKASVHLRGARELNVFSMFMSQICQFRNNWMITIATQSPQPQFLSTRSQFLSDAECFVTGNDRKVGSNKIQQRLACNTCWKVQYIENRISEDKCHESKLSRKMEIMFSALFN